MGQLRDITKIKKLASRFGTPLLYTEHLNGILFAYSVEGAEVKHYYNDESRGIDEEVTRLQRLIQSQKEI